MYRSGSDFLYCAILLLYSVSTALDSGSYHSRANILFAIRNELGLTEKKPPPSWEFSGNGELAGVGW